MTSSLSPLSLEVYRQAIQAREFTFYYQPIINDEDELVSFEALMRWTHEGQVVSPAIFLSDLERFHLLHPLTESLIEDVVQAFPLLCARFVHLNYVSVNIEANQLLRSEFFDALKMTQGSPVCLAFEIVETVPMPAKAEVDTQIAQLKQLGVGLHLDDIGRGYSTLDSLNSYDFDLGKIDRQVLVDAFEKGESDRLERMIRLIDSSGRRVVVEGVETYAQMQFVRQMAQAMSVHVCIQGFYFSRPEPLDYWLEEKRVFERFR